MYFGVCLCFEFLCISDFSVFCATNNDNESVWMEACERESGTRVSRVVMVEGEGERQGGRKDHWIGD